MNKRANNPKREPITVAAIVPARAIRQRVPQKNLQLLGGKTLLAWAIEVGHAAEKVDVVLVSTEDEKTAVEARAYGAIVIPRPVALSQPTSTDAEFYDHAVRWLETEHGWQPEVLVNLRPTSPLRFPADVDAMVEYMLNNPAVDGVKSVIPTPSHPYKMWQFADEKSHPIGQASPLKPVFDNEFRQERGPDQPRQQIQELYPVYLQDGQIDITRRQFILRPECLERHNVWGENLFGYVLDERTSTDLDTPADFRHAEKVYAEIQAEQNK